MKTTILRCSIFLLFTGCCLLTRGQGNYWGLTADGGGSGLGALFSAKDSTHVNVGYAWPADMVGTASLPVGGLTVFNGTLYGVTAQGGDYGSGTIFSYDPAAATYKVLYSFQGGTDDGGSPNPLVVFNNKLYGTATTGGANYNGSLFAFDPSAAPGSQGQLLISFGNYGSANHDGGPSPLVAYNGKLYGTTNQGGGPDAAGMLFAYDNTDAANPLTVLYEFTYTSTDPGANPGGGLVVSNGLLFGTCGGGGAYGNGTIFSYAPAGNIISVAHSFQDDSFLGVQDGYYTTGFPLAYNGHIYGVCDFGGLNGSGTFFDFNTADNSYHVRQDLTASSISCSPGLCIYNQKVYGAVGSGDLFVYDPSNVSYRVLTNAAGALAPIGYMLPYNSSLYGFSNNTVFSLDPASGAVAQQLFFSIQNSMGASPVGSPVFANSRLYGLTSAGGQYNLGVLWSYDPFGGQYNKLLDLDGSATGSSLTSGLSAYGGRLYGSSTSGGKGGSGRIFSYGLTTGKLTGFYDFQYDDTSANNLTGDLVGVGGKLYGMSGSGGPTGAGCIYEFDTTSLALHIDYSFSSSTVLRPYGGLVPGDNGLLYGLVSGGGANGQGAILSFDPVSKQVTTLFSFVSRTLTAYSRPGVQALACYDHKLYFFGGNNILYNYYTLYSLDLTNLAAGPQTLYVFQVDGSGQPVNGNPQPALSVDTTRGKLSGYARDGGAGPRGYQYEVDLATGVFSKFTDLSATTGSSFSGESAPLFLPDRDNPSGSFITFNALPATKYGSADFVLQAISTNPAVPVVFTSQDTSLAKVYQDAADGNQWKVKVLKPGRDTIIAGQAGDASHTAADSVKEELVISRALLTVNAADTIGAAGQPLPSFRWSYSGWVGADSAVAGIISGTPFLSSTGTASSPVGTYPITVTDVSSLSSAYYDFTPGAAAVLTLSAYQPQIIQFATLPATTYGDADIALSATTDASGLTVNYTSSNSSVATVVNGKLHVAGAGSVVITALQPGDINYAPADVPQTLTVLPAPLIITADDKSVGLGDPFPVLTATYSGFVNGETVSVLQPPVKLTTTATPSSIPGTYDIQPSDAASPDYSVSFVKGTLTIKGTAQTGSWTVADTVTYGDVPFTLNATSSYATTPVYRSGDTTVISVLGNQATIKGAGTATITATFPAAYGLDSAVLTRTIAVLPRQLIITADNQTRSVGQPDPLLTASYSGWAVGDNTANVLITKPVLTTTVTASTPEGAYPIKAGGATAANYVITYVDGTLTIVPANTGSNSLEAWCSSRSQLQVRLYSTRNQAVHAAIQLIGLAGNRVYSQEYQLNPGINSYEIPVGAIPTGVYILKVVGEDFSLNQKTLIR